MPEAKSRASTNATLSPRVAASKAHPGHYSAADHHDVELLGSESLPGDRALCRSQRRGGPPLPAVRCLDWVAHETGSCQLLVGRWCGTKASCSAAS